MARNLVGTIYRDMPGSYRERVSKEEYKKRRRAQRMAGDAIGQSEDGVEKYREDAFNVSDLSEFDTRATGDKGAVGGDKSDANLVYYPGYENWSDGLPTGNPYGGQYYGGSIVQGADFCMATAKGAGESRCGSGLDD